MDAIFVSGDPNMVDYTPGSAKTGGTVIVVGDLPFIAHRDIAANELGALAAGGGVYDVIAGEAIAAGKRVYWDDTANKVVETSSGNTGFGYVIPGSSAAQDGDTIRVLHQPFLDSTS